MRNTSSVLSPTARQTLACAVVCALFVAPWAVQAQEAAPAPSTQATPTGSAPTASPFLWEVESDVGTSYLFGTIHVGVGIDDLDPAVHGALARADGAVFEADVRTINPLEVFRLAQYPEGASLADDLSPEELERVVAAASGLLPREALVRMRPWFVMTLLLNEFVGGSMPVDLQLLQAAEAQGDAVGFLESWRDQLDAFARIPQDYAIASVIEMAESPERTREELDALIQAYRDADAAALEALVLAPEEREQYPAFFDALMTERNEAWVEPLEAHFGARSTFVGVGVGHLLGEGSVIELLEARGWTITRVEAGE